MSVLKIKSGNQWVNIPTIKGDKGEDGGKSAYEYAVDGGYQGTEEQFATKLATEYVTFTDYASTNQSGVVKVHSYYGTDIQSNGILSVAAAADSQIKAGTTPFAPIVPGSQHTATFYGLAKAAGANMNNSNNAVGTYTEEAKSAIYDMLNAPVTVSGTSPTIVAKSGVRYVCGEVTSISFTPSASGICDVRFTSGSTVAVLTVPNTVKFPAWFDPTTLEPDTVYEISIEDGVYGTVMTWQ